MAKRSSTRRRPRSSRSGGGKDAPPEASPALDLSSSAWEYSPAPETTPVPLRKQYEHFIGGKMVAPGSGKYFRSINPATGKAHARIAEGGTRDIDRAVKAARKALVGPWGKLPAGERSKYLFRIARMIQERSRELAILETMDGGKPIRERRDIDLP